jgi:large subunit ribosomal protein L14
MLKALIVRTKKKSLRQDGSYICFSDNAAIIINEIGNPLGTRIFGPVPKEIRFKGYTKIMSISPYIV